MGTTQSIGADRTVDSTAVSRRRAPAYRERLTASPATAGATLQKPHLNEAFAERAILTPEPWPWDPLWGRPTGRFARAVRARRPHVSLQLCCAVVISWIE
jgi:hypothetical protein